MKIVRKNFYISFLALLLIFSVILTQARPYAQGYSCEVSNRKEGAYDEMLKLDAIGKANVEDLHLSFGLMQSPASATNEHLLYQDEYIIM